MAAYLTALGTPRSGGLLAGISTSRPSVLFQRGGHGYRCLHASRLMASQTGAPPPQIDVVFTDVDGTLLNSQQQLPERVAQAVNRAVDVGVQVILATGKARGPWLNDVLPRLNVRGPSLFLQGLLIYGPDGTLWYSKALEDDVVVQVLDFAEQHGLTISVYSGDRILCHATDEHTDRLLFYREPPPEGVGPLRAQLGKEPFHKMILMAPHERILELRPAVEELLKGQATLTTALPGMLEVLPLGASKGAGVELVMQRLGLDASRTMAVGDGENDLEMIQLAAWGVAMGNAGDKVKQLAQHVTLTNDEEGLGVAIERFVLEPRAASTAVTAASSA